MADNDSKDRKRKAPAGEATTEEGGGTKNPQPALPNWCTAGEFKSMLQCIPGYQECLKQERYKDELSQVTNRIVPGGEDEAWMDHEIVDLIAKFEMIEKTTILELATRKNQDVAKEAAAVMIPGVMEFLEEESEYEESGFAQQWQKNEDWYCYWEDGNNNPNRYVFRPALIELKDGIVRSPANWDPTRLPPVHIVEKLQKLGERMQQEELTSGYMSEGDYAWQPILIPWPDDATVVTPSSILEQLGVHPEIAGTLQIDNDLKWDEYPDEGKTGEDSDDDDDDDDEYDDKLPFPRHATIRRDVYKLFLQCTHGKAPLSFSAGCDRFNPYPYLVVAKLTSGFVGGFITALVAT